MELNITKFFTEACAKNYSASVAEIGANAGPSTWAAANDDAADYDLLNDDEKREAFREHIAGFGAWDETEISAFTNQELNALFIQMISGDMREAGLDTQPIDWKEYEQGTERGIYLGRIFRADIGPNAGEIFYYIGD